MIRVVTLVLLVVFPLFLLSGCGGSSTATSSSTAQTPSVAPDPSLVLPQEPAGAKNVAEVREKGKNGEEVVVAGWVGGSLEPIIKGRAAFTMVDLQLPAPECTTKPYSYCCMPKEALLPNLIMVKFVDGDGKTILKDARELLGIKEGCIVVVRGHIECSEDGTVNSIVANALFDRGYSENPLKLSVLNTGFQPSK
jgi:hypothetical protein